MGRHLPWILLNKVLIQVHVARFQTKLSPHNSRGTPPSHTHTPDNSDPPSLFLAPNVFIQHNIRHQNS